MIGVETRFVPAGVHKGSRIRAKCSAGQVTIPYPYELDVYGGHRLAVQALAEKLGFKGEIHMGSHPDGSGYVAVIS